MPPKRGFYIAQDTPNVSPKLESTRDHQIASTSSIFPVSGAAFSPNTRSRGFSLPSPVAMSSLSVPRPIRRPRKILYVFVILAALYWFGVRHGLGIERADPLPLGFAPPRGHRSRPRTMNFARNGLAALLPVRAKTTPEHPFYELMERAEENWRMILNRQSKTLQSAVKEYKRRYGIEPPRGFDLWFQYAQENNVKLVDEFDLMMRDVLAHHALEPKTYVNRTRVLEGQPFTYTVDITNAGTEVSGPRAKNPRPKKLAGMIDGFRQALPPGFNVRITGSDHDVSSVVLGKDQRKRAMEHVRKGEYFTPDELAQYENPRRTPAFGWFKACPLDSPANRRADAEYEKGEHDKVYIHDHVATMDFCEFPQLKVLHGALCIDREDRSPSLLKPWIVHSKLPGDASFLLPPIDGFTNMTEADIPSLGTWEQKLDPRVHWRGSTTGGVDHQLDWHKSHRMRLHFMFNPKKGNDTDFAALQHSVMQPDGQGGYEIVERSAKDLSHSYADVKLAGKSIQCPKSICEEMTAEIDYAPVVLPKNTWMFRYVMDVDGNGWSERFHRLLSSASPVLKMTMFADWHMDRLIPWYHYIPIQPDYSDLYDVLSFFIGPLRPDGSVDHDKGHDYLGHKIGQAGQEFAMTQWRWVDMQAYMFRLLLELARLQSTDRASMNYKPIPMQ